MFPSKGFEETYASFKENCKIHSRHFYRLDTFLFSRGAILALDIV